jgi:hypothetical protein
MNSVSDKFDLQATLQAIGQAVTAVMCHMIFDFALYGLFMAVLLALAGAVYFRKRHRFGRPLLTVSRRVAMVCIVLSLPGVCSLVFYHALPSAGVFNVSSIGFICAWALIFLHLSAEEIEHSQTAG